MDPYRDLAAPTVKAVCTWCRAELTFVNDDTHVECPACGANVSRAFACRAREAMVAAHLEPIVVTEPSTRPLAPRFVAVHAAIILLGIVAMMVCWFPPMAGVHTTRMMVLTGCVALAFAVTSFLRLAIWRR